MSTYDQSGETPSEEELRAAYEEQLKAIRIEQVLLENVVTLINLGMRRTGLAPGTEDERDPDQVRLAIEGVRTHLPLVEGLAPQQAGQIREALSQLQLAYVRIGGRPPAGETGVGAGAGATAGGAPSTGPPAPRAPDAPAPKPGEPGPAQRAGRLWIPGQ